MKRILAGFLEVAAVLAFLVTFAALYDWAEPWKPDGWSHIGWGLTLLVTLVAALGALLAVGAFVWGAITALRFRLRKGEWPEELADAERGRVILGELRTALDEIDGLDAATPAERRALARALIEAKVAERVEKLDAQARAEMAAIERQDPDFDVQIEYDRTRRG